MAGLARNFCRIPAVHFRAGPRSGLRSSSSVAAQRPPGPHRHPMSMAAANKNPSCNTLWRSRRNRKESIMAAKPIPEGFHTVTPYLTVRGAEKVIAFLQQAFGAQAQEVIHRPDGSIMHAQVTIGDSRVMIAEESEMAKATQSTLYLYVPNVDSVYQQAVKAG